MFTIKLRTHQLLLKNVWKYKSFLILTAILSFSGQSSNSQYYTLPSNKTHDILRNVIILVNGSNTKMNALDYLNNTANVFINYHGYITFENTNNVLVYEDDKPTNFSGNDLINYLESFDSKKIDKIEILFFSPKKYNVLNNVGIINIQVIKKQRKTIIIPVSLSKN